MNKPLIVILGPTSTGKTSLAISLCKKFNGEIISADSRQVYKYMDVGTGKVPIGKNVAIEKLPGTWKVDGVYIHCYDLVLPNQPFTVVDYARRARAEIESCWRRNKVPFLIGGTGFYIDVVLGKIKPSGVPPDLKLRAELEKLSCAELFERLKNFDPIRSENIDVNNKHRLVRAVEIAQKIGFSYDRGVYRSLYSTVPHDLSSSVVGAGESMLAVGLSASSEYLYKRINAWVDELIASGRLEAEVRNLVKLGFKDAEVMKGIIYKSTAGYIDGEISQEELRERIKFDLHGYIRRQLTWFKKSENVHWFDISKSGFDNEVETLVSDYLGWGKI